MRGCRAGWVGMGARWYTKTVRYALCAMHYVLLCAIVVWRSEMDCGAIRSWLKIEMRCTQSLT